MATSLRGLLRTIDSAVAAHRQERLTPAQVDDVFGAARLLGSVARGLYDAGDGRGFDSPPAQTHRAGLVHELIRWSERLPPSPSPTPGHDRRDGTHTLLASAAHDLVAVHTTGPALVVNVAIGARPYWSSAVAIAHTVGVLTREALRNHVPDATGAMAALDSVSRAIEGAKRADDPAGPLLDQPIPIGHLTVGLPGSQVCAEAMTALTAGLGALVADGLTTYEVISVVRVVTVVTSYAQRVAAALGAVEPPDAAGAWRAAGKAMQLFTDGDTRVDGPSALQRWSHLAQEGLRTTYGPLATLTADMILGDRDLGAVTTDLRRSVAAVPQLGHVLATQVQRWRAGSRPLFHRIELLPRFDAIAAADPTTRITGADTRSDRRDRDPVLDAALAETQIRHGAVIADTTAVRTIGAAIDTATDQSRRLVGLLAETGPAIGHDPMPELTAWYRDLTKTQPPEPSSRPPVGDPPIAVRLQHRAGHEACRNRSGRPSVPPSPPQRPSGPRR